MGNRLLSLPEAVTSSVGLLTGNRSNAAGALDCGYRRIGGCAAYREQASLLQIQCAFL